MYCHNCGQQSLNNARFCRGCGTRLVAPKEAIIGDVVSTGSEHTQSTYTSQPWSEKSIFIAVILGGIFIVVCGASIYMNLTAGAFFLALAIISGSILLFTHLLMPLLHKFLAEETTVVPRPIYLARSTSDLNTKNISLSTPSALPAAQSVNIAHHIPQPTDAAEIVQPPSVTEHTTHLLHKDEG